MARMRLLTRAIMDSLPRLYSQEGDYEAKVRVKFFDPTGAGTWYATEASAFLDVEGEDDVLEVSLHDCLRTYGLERIGYRTVHEGKEVRLLDVHFFGLVTGLGYPELGVFALSDLESHKCRLLLGGREIVTSRIGIERDLYWDAGQSLMDVMTEAGMVVA